MNTIDKVRNGQSITQHDRAAPLLRLRRTHRDCHQSVLNEVWFDRGNGWERDALPNLSLNMCSNLAKALATFAGLTIPLGEANPVASVIFPDGERGKLLFPLPLKTALSA